MCQSNRRIEFSGFYRLNRLPGNLQFFRQLGLGQVMSCPFYFDHIFHVFIIVFFKFLFDFLKESTLHPFPKAPQLTSKNNVSLHF